VPLVASASAPELNKAIYAVLEVTEGYFLVSFPCSSTERSIHLLLLVPGGDVFLDRRS
jgi:hypothetical protein